MSTKLCVIEGDGIGQEVVPAAVSVLQAVMPELEIVTAEAGWNCFLKHGVSVPVETLESIQECGAALFGATSSPSYKVEGYRSAIITMRQALSLYANIRPIQSWPRVSPRDRVDLILVRENTEGLYSGREKSDGKIAVAERVITKAASRRIAERALSLAKMLRRQKLTIVHKANVLFLTDGLFRDTVREVAEEFASKGFILDVDELLVDVASLKMATEPERFDVVVTTNLFGDILSDVAAHWGGGLGLAPSLNWGDKVALAEPVHGSAPDLAGQGLANPIAAILSGALLARYVWGRGDVAARIEAAVTKVLTEGIPNHTHKVTQSILQIVKS